MDKSFLDNFSVLPAMPNVLVRALNIIKQENSGTKELAAIMSYDPALSTQVLKLVNSAYYGFPQQITSISKALALLGMMQAKNVIIAVAMKPMLTNQGGKELWKHSIKTAVASEILAQQYKIIDPQEAFVSGFLHDIGKIVMSLNNKALCDKINNLVLNGADELQAEQTFFGTTHAEIGFILARKWQLSVLLGNCIKYHHQPKASSIPNVTALIHIANRLVKDEVPKPLVSQDILAGTNFNPNEILEMRQDIISKASSLLSQLGS